MALAARLIYLTRSYAVNLMYSDQWIYFTAELKHVSLLSTYRWQLGPHRMGLGLLVERGIGATTSWNNNAVSYLGVSLLILASLVFLATIYRLFGGLVLADITIVLTLITFRAHEHLVIVPFTSHSLLPLLLLAILSAAFVTKRVTLGVIVIVITIPLLVFTGFGIAVGPALVLLVFFERFQFGKFTTRGKLTLLVTALAYGLFVIGYKLQGTTLPTSDTSQVAAARETIVFFIQLFSNAVGITQPRSLTIVVGTFCLATVMATLTGLVLFDAKTSEGTTRRYVPILLIGFSLTFAAMTALGRAGTGHEPFTSRYIVLLLPAFVGLYFAVRQVNLRWLRVGLAAALLAVTLVVASSLPNSEALTATREGKLRWADAFVCTGSIEYADSASGFQLLALPQSQRPQWHRELQVKLDFLRDNEWGFFAGGPIATGHRAPRCDDLTRVE